MLSKADSQDREIAAKHLHWYYSDPKLTYEEEIDRVIEAENEVSKNLGNFLLKALEVYKKYSSARFWFYVEIL